MAGALAGKVFNGRYKIIDRIGIGGMAEVYSAQDSVLGRTVAVKVMLPQYAENPDFAARFKQEAASAANLSSPYIVNIYDWGQSEGVYYIVMELVRGTDLKTGINNRGAINQRKVAEIGSQVCSALSVAHKQDIVHRDIKPQNIMVQPDGNIKVMDFGIARAKGASQTQTSSVLGTAHYISPEQAQGKDLDGLSDIYSLGIVLFESVTGKLPFDGPDAISVAMKQVNEQPPLPSSINPKVDPQLEAIIMKAMAKNPRDRFESANDMRIALNDFLAGRPMNFEMPFSSAKTAYLGSGVPVRNGNQRQGGIAKTAVMPVQRGTGEGQAGGMIPANITGGTGTVRSYRRGTAAEEEKPRGISRRTVFGIVGAVVALAIIGVLAFILFGGSKEKTVEVPNVVGMTAAEATVVLKECGLSVGTTDKSYDSDAESGKIISQDPGNGNTVTEGSKVNIVVSLGAEEVTVPDLSKMTAAEAQTALTKAGLVARAGTAEYSADIEVNHVMSQNPQAGTVVTKGDTVEYILSLGAENITVPAVVGKSQEEAEETLRNAGFKVEATTVYSSTIEKGLIVSQNPNGGKLEKGGTVKLEISEGPDPATIEHDIPNVVGKSIASAKTALTDAGFTVTVSGPDTATATVSAQSPTGKAVKGTNITITTKESSSSSSSSSSSE